MIWGTASNRSLKSSVRGLDSEASNAIIKIVEKPAPRPVWISVWGGPREVAQIIWDVKQTRSEPELKKFFSKLRIFLIAYQDASHGWLLEEFPEMFIIESGKTYQAMCGEHDKLSDLSWVNENIRKEHGPLSEIYSHEGMGCTGVCEGDSPACLHLVCTVRGISNPEDPTQPSWGGQYEKRRRQEPVHRWSRRLLHIEMAQRFSEGIRRTSTLVYRVSYEYDCGIVAERMRFISACDDQGWLTPLPF
ncbi:nucleoside hydrolase-like domain-containing protein [Aureliella helgolandensis]|uniref:Cellulose-binding Sde182 nucleoside hydrolase-like domain-containing protein n=1 Tax=Aureliella helgolandensis TaxID=2527968 RepID=A0A518GB79_9BACT|nr:nucleoside hydrolase-like domain-containing protein [Aureliella helgolandensis]QDV25844.1 hypothetical protein Q31a_41720 [Aureliella helgolandensis]